MKPDRSTISYPGRAVRRQVVAIVPARNEPDIAATVHSLKAQTRPVDLVCVVTNNCSRGDATAADAKAAGAYVIDMPNNRHLKAGALNRGLDGLDVYLNDEDAVLLMDADGVLAPDWVENALPQLDDHGALSGAFEAIRLPGFLPLMQRTEYAQARHRITQRGGNVHVLSGAAAMVSMRVLRQVRDNRGTFLPGRRGDWYDTTSKVEDFELTLAIRRLGWQPASPGNLHVQTDVMRSHRDLWRQRIRWQEGYLRTLVRYPLRLTKWAWLVQAWVYAVALAPLLVAVLLAHGVAGGTFEFQPLWLALPPVFALAEMWAAKRAGWRSVLLAAAVVPIWLYALWRNSVYYVAAVRAVTSTNNTWH